MLVNGITPLNCKNSGKQKTFQNNRVSNQNQPSFKAWKIRSSRFSDWFVKRGEELCKLIEAVRLEKIDADITALRKAGENEKFIESRLADYDLLIPRLQNGETKKKVSIPEIDNGKEEFSSLRNYWAKHPQELDLEQGDITDWTDILGQ